MYNWFFAVLALYQIQANKTPMHTLHRNLRDYFRLKSLVETWEKRLLDHRFCRNVERSIFQPRRLPYICDIKHNVHIDVLVFQIFLHAPEEYLERFYAPAPQSC